MGKTDYNYIKKISLEQLRDDFYISHEIIETNPITLCARVKCNRQKLKNFRKLRAKMNAVRAEIRRNNEEWSRKAEEIAIRRLGVIFGSPTLTSGCRVGHKS